MDLSNKREELGRNGVTVLKETCVASLNPKICLGTSAKRGGRGLYAKDFIGKGEWIWRDAPGYAAAPKSWEQLSELPESALKNFLHFCYSLQWGVADVVYVRTRNYLCVLVVTGVGDNKFIGCIEFDTTPVEEWADVRPSDDSMYMNHSCDPTCWFAYPDRKVTESCRFMVAIRDIRPGEEITFDYATSEAHPSFEGFECTCGASDCRAVLSHDDWKKPFIQHKYAGHFLRHIAVKIAGYQTSSLYALEVRNSSNMGRYLACGAPVPKGEIIMCLPPNLLLTEAELENPEQVLQVAPDLFSSSFSMDDLDNYLNHACDPTTRAVIREDYTIDLFTTRDLAPGDAITIDYELFEDDLISQGVDFKCECGSPLCRGRIVGAQVRKQLYPEALDGMALTSAGKDVEAAGSTCCGAGCPVITCPTVASVPAPTSSPSHE